MSRIIRVYLSFLGVAIALLTVSCNSESNSERNPIKDSETVKIFSSINPLRAYDQTWEDGDEIGVFAIKAGSSLETTTIFGGANNMVYYTPNGDGKFVAKGKSLQLSKTEAIDLVSYYPQQSVGDDFLLQLDVSDQSDLPAIDLMYSDNAKGIKASNPNAYLEFKHQLSQLILSVTSEKGATDLTGLKVSIDGFSATGVYDLAQGKLASVGSDKSTIVMNDYATNGGTAERRALLLPGQSYEAMQLTFVIGGKEYKYKQEQAAVLAPNTIYRLQFILSEKGVLSLAGSIIEIVEGGSSTLPAHPTDEVVDVPGDQIPVSREALSFTADDTMPIAVMIDALEGETWSATSSASFVKLTQTATSGPGSLIIALEENTTGEERTAEVRVVGTRETGTVTASLRSGIVRETIITITQLSTDKPIPDPTPTPTDKAWYMEQPVISSGMMTDITIAHHNAPDSWFSGGSTVGGVRRNFTIYYSKDNRQPYMVAYPLYRDCYAQKGTDRTNRWEYDPVISREFQPVLYKGYNPSTYSRGHMLPSAHRLASRRLNEQTFYFTNMVPQNQNQNGGVWERLENAERSISDRVDTLYVVCGPTIDPNSISISDNTGNRVKVPTHTWKVLYWKEAGGHRSVGFKIPNSARPKGDSFKNYAVSVASLEKELGVTFFTHLDPAVAEGIKSQKSTNNM